MRANWFMGIALLVLLGPACARMPDHFKIGEDVYPENIDEQVRFRTDYYFMVNAGGGSENPQDRLYRFRMTGKASSLWNRTAFESGVLHKSQIDPFGSQIAYNWQAGRYEFSSGPELPRKVNQSARLAETLDTLLTEVQGLKDDQETLGQLKAALEKARQDTGSAHGTLRDNLGKIRKQLDPLKEPAKPESVRKIAAKVETALLEFDPDMPGAADPNVGFTIIGPEGSRRYDQDYRLLMTMSSDGTPLISTMQELSGRMLNERPAAEALLQDIAAEQVSSLKALLALHENSGETDTRKLLKAVLDAFNASGATGASGASGASGAAGGTP
ncbi:hypothetical protein [Desulfocurvibacter africanus]|uniref:Lipoprotein n=1 Tax=Desulfocurvibacter africanus subsp. africanus str. Walvis Bay TaxID=690850 RepID=F3YXG7_DESAF|nr:hypothetical protein [Desulfocurvibacter africanus]EGJ51744.1 hypothetical protein Desaf_3460 [Desulfocurvibacter africanus subsp. africanus str. Walvis Bay]